MMKRFTEAGYRYCVASEGVSRVLDLESSARSARTTGDLSADIRVLIRRMMRHANPEMTLGTYQQPIDQSVREAANPGQTRQRSTLLAHDSTKAMAPIAGPEGHQDFLGSAANY